MRPISIPVPGLSPRAEESRPLRLGNLHWGPLVAAISLALIGLATVSSASAESSVDYLPRQGFWILVGLVGLVLVFSIDYHALIDLAPIFYGGAMLLLCAVLVTAREIGGARSWIGIGGFGGQPSEIAKLATALMLARYLARVRQPFLGIRHLSVVGLIVAVPVFLVILENDLGSASMFGPMTAAMLMVAGVRLRHVVIAVAILGLLGAGYWASGARSHQVRRVMSFLEPDSDPLGAGYQVRQSKIAVGSGQWVGRGYGQGTQSQLRFLPARHTDFVAAVLAEEWGFLGVVAVLSLYALFLISTARVAARSRDRAGILLLAGLLGLFSFHVLYNTAMVVGLLPITGIPLPFLSYGGSFMLVNFLITGLVLNVDYRRYVNR